MTADDASGAVTIWDNGFVSMRADDLGVTVGRHDIPDGGKRFLWSEISRFADGHYSTEEGTIWRLVLVLHSGREVSYRWEPTDELLTNVRQVAERYGIAAELSGIPMSGGRPTNDGLYEDPWGQAGLRYWGGGQWSPLLPLDVLKSRSGGPRKGMRSAESWSLLPVAADGSWTYAATWARRLRVWSVGAASAFGVTVTVGVIRLWSWWNGGAPHHRLGGGVGLWFAIAFAFGPCAAYAQIRHTEFRKLDAAARKAAEGV